MPINTDVYVYAGRFARSGDAFHRLVPGRGVWMQVVEGTASVEGLTFRTADGAGFTAPRKLSFSFDEETELLLVDERMDAPRVWE